MLPPARISRRPNGRRASPDGVPRVAPLSIAQSIDGLLVRRVRVSPEDVVFVKGVLEASEGLAAMFADHGGELSIAAPLDRGDDLADLEREVGAILLADEVHGAMAEAVRLDG